MSQIRGRLIRKVHTSRNFRFHVYELQTSNRRLQAIYYGYHQPTVNREMELLLTGKWHQNAEYGTQFHITRYEDALPYIALAKSKIDQLLRLVAR